MSDALFTDLYELTMTAGYVDEGCAHVEATFDLFFRKPPQYHCSTCGSAVWPPSKTWSLRTRADRSGVRRSERLGALRARLMHQLRDDLV